MEFLAHLFLPRHSNNYRSKLLHHNILFFFIAILFIGSFLFVQAKRSYPQVLGISSDITNEELLLLINNKRIEEGLMPLKMNESLNSAAEKKADHMFSNNYWAHVSPDGTTPWFFIKDAGYQYVYAGENLAKGFTTAGEVVEAWMASPKHRENALSQNYQDVGFAVKTGKLAGEDTVLIVQEFGGKDLDVAPASGFEILSSPVASSVQAATSARPYINSLLFSSNAYIIIIALFMLVLILDMWIVQKHKIIRIAGHNMDHILFFMTFLLAGFLIAKGVVV